MTPARSTKGFLAFFFALFMLAACAETAEHRSTGETVDDAAITARVKAAFAKSPDVDAMDVNVDTYKGDVVLSGYADDRGQIARAGEIARGVEGVHAVKNDLRPKSQTGSNY
jgi:hyperosmotically inducible protein